VAEGAGTAPVVLQEASRTAAEVGEVHEAAVAARGAAQVGLGTLVVQIQGTEAVVGGMVPVAQNQATLVGRLRI
jgi:hypothetical protein